ncbi:translation initiation factor IF-2 subunit alpha [Candidatus Woesearchaeota archaeon]|jgi:translation initiation factor 2 subunit 1|nr:translation initiation factor IF-2 subunit alpha [Candidatus Woesearchaeota archaeon]MBT7366992.1 translation initiation factor IF-2 subunit alpha [Candidatus Woesearchaeota archaeon]
MHRTKKGLPEEGEVLLCSVTKIYPHCVFVNIDDYSNKSGMIHISEISPGRIRNIHDYVKEGKKIVCKVLKLDLEKGHIDLSLRRVTEMQKRNKIDSIKQEQKAEKIVEFVANKLKMKFEALYDILGSKIIPDYENIYPCFEEYITDETALTEYNFSKEIMKELDEVIKQRIKPSIKIITGDFNIQSYAPNGVDIIRKVLEDALTITTDSSIKYVGGGRYGLEVRDEDYKEAEKKLKLITEFVLSEIEKQDGTAEFIRAEKKD